MDVLGVRMKDGATELRISPARRRGNAPSLGTLTVEGIVSKMSKVGGGVVKSGDTCSNDWVVRVSFLFRRWVRRIPRVKEERIGMIPKATEGVNGERVAVYAMLLTMREHR